MSDRYHGYTFLFRALQGKTKFDYFNGRKAEVLQNSLKEALSELATEHQGKKVEEYRLKTVMDSFHPVSVLGYFLHQPITSSVGELQPFPLVDRGTENHIVNLEAGAIKGENITAPGTSGFISQGGQRNKHLDDQLRMFVDFEYKPMLFDRETVMGSAEATKQVEFK